MKDFLNFTQYSWFTNLSKVSNTSDSGKAEKSLFEVPEVILDFLAYTDYFLIIAVVLLALILGLYKYENKYKNNIYLLVIVAIIEYIIIKEIAKNYYENSDEKFFITTLTVLSVLLLGYLFLIEKFHLILVLIAFFGLLITMENEKGIIIFLRLEIPVFIFYIMVSLKEKDIFSAGGTLKYFKGSAITDVYQKSQFFVILFLITFPKIILYYVISILNSILEQNLVIFLARKLSAILDSIHEIKLFKVSQFITNYTKVIRSCAKYQNSAFATMLMGLTPMQQYSAMSLFFSLILFAVTLLLLAQKHVIFRNSIVITYLFHFKVIRYILLASIIVERYILMLTMDKFKYYLWLNYLVLLSFMLFRFNILVQGNAINHIPLWFIVIFLTLTLIFSLLRTLLKIGYVIDNLSEDYSHVNTLLTELGELLGKTSKRMAGQFFPKGSKPPFIDSAEKMQSITKSGVHVAFGGVVVGTGVWIEAHRANELHAISNAIAEKNLEATQASAKAAQDSAKAAQDSAKAAEIAAQAEKQKAAIKSVKHGLMSREEYHQKCPPQNPAK